MKRECETCIKRKTPYFPTSIECMATDDMPYYQNRIMILKENEQLKEELKYTIGIVEHNKIISEKNKEIHQLKDNWIMLKEWLEKELGDRINPNKDKWLTGVYDAYRETIDKMQKLEQGSDSNE